MSKQLEKFLIQETPVYPGGFLVVLSDYKYWAQNFDELTDYCRERRLEQDGLIVVLPDEAEVLLFKIRWQ